VGRWPRWREPHPPPPNRRQALGPHLLGHRVLTAPHPAGVQPPRQPRAAGHPAAFGDDGRHGGGQPLPPFRSPTRRTVPVGVVPGRRHPGGAARHPHRPGAAVVVDGRSEFTPLPTPPTIPGEVHTPAVGGPTPGRCGGSSTRSGRSRRSSACGSPTFPPPTCRPGPRSGSPSPGPAATGGPAARSTPRLLGVPVLGLARRMRGGGRRRRVTLPPQTVAAPSPTGLPAACGGGYPVPGEGSSVWRAGQPGVCDHCGRTVTKPAQDRGDSGRVRARGDRFTLLYRII
jgi:hypothetical protein